MKIDYDTWFEIVKEDLEIEFGLDREKDPEFDIFCEEQYRLWISEIGE